ncbi:hypothetical protein [Rhodococcus koreensis]|uniref:hypothetical protein n=1 Tax=Rhodococcus koreensis TaxID=99653 RepID=UPI0036DC755B
MSTLETLAKQERNRLADKALDYLAALVTGLDLGPDRMYAVGRLRAAIDGLRDAVIEPEAVDFADLAKSVDLLVADEILAGRLHAARDAVGLSIALYHRRRQIADGEFDE